MNNLTDPSGLGYQAGDAYPEWAQQDPNPPRKKRRWWIAVLAVALVMLGTGAAGAWYVQKRLAALDQNINRFGDPFKQGTTDRPASEGGMNILLLGSDSRISAGNPADWEAGAQRTDAIMVAHIPADKKAAYVISIPRDSWVSIPGHNSNKINAAYSYGGPSLMVQTVEQLTNVRIDHMVIVDFEGFKDLTDELGGVQITVPKSTKDERAVFKAGTYTMDGETALNYVRQRHNLPGGDFDRVKRQQNWIRAVMKKTLSSGTLTNVSKLDGVMESMSKSIATDDGFTFEAMRSMALSMRSLRSQDVAFLTAPVAGTGRSEDGQSVVRLDLPANEALWQAVAADGMVTYLQENAPELLSDKVN